MRDLNKSQQINVLRGESIFFSFCQLDTTGRSFDVEVIPLPRVFYEYKQKKKWFFCGFLKDFKWIWILEYAIYALKKKTKLKYHDVKWTQKNHSNIETLNTSFQLFFWYVLGEYKESICNCLQSVSLPESSHTPQTPGEEAGEGVRIKAEKNQTPHGLRQEQFNN